MKAFLLAAGEGRRLRPLTNKVPKCLVPVNGLPLLGRWLRQCSQYGINEVLINLYHLQEKVRSFLDHYDCGVKVTAVYEPRLLGTASTVALQKQFVAGEKEFFIIYADNLTNVNLGEMLQFHRQRRSPFTMGLFRADKPEEKGIVALDLENRITEFVEKPAKPQSNLANAGLYIAGPELYSYLPVDLAAEKTLDFGFDVLPQLVGKMYGYVIDDFFLDIGTPENYQKAQVEWPKAVGENDVFR